MKSYVIEIAERDEIVLLEILRRFAVNIQPSNTSNRATKPLKNRKTKVEPKTIAHFLEISRSLDGWSDEDITAVTDFHNQLNQYQPAAW